VRKKIGPMLVAAVLLAVLMPAASADVCLGPSCGGGGGGGGGGTSPFNHLSISNGGPGISAQPVQEDNPCFFTIHRSNPRGQNTTVHWHTKDGTATSQPEAPPGSNQGKQQGSSDYQAASGVVTFNAEQPRNIPISVQTNQDNSPPSETSEYFFVVISHAVNGVIVDNAGKCVITQPQGG